MAGLLRSEDDGEGGALPMRVTLSRTIGEFAATAEAECRCAADIERLMAELRLAGSRSGYLTERGVDRAAERDEDNPAHAPEHREDWCSKHRCAMERSANDRGSWYSHRVVTLDGETLWCKGHAGSKGWDVALEDCDAEAMRGGSYRPHMGRRGYAGNGRGRR